MKDEFHGLSYVRILKNKTLILVEEENCSFVLLPLYPLLEKSLHAGLFLKVSNVILNDWFSRLLSYDFLTILKLECKKPFP